MLRIGVILTVAVVVLTTNGALAQTIERRPLPSPLQPDGTFSDPAQDYEAPIDPVPDDQFPAPDDQFPPLDNAEPGTGAEPYDPLANDPFSTGPQQDPPVQPDANMVAPDAEQMGGEVSEPAPAVEDRPVKNKVAVFTGIDKITGRIHHFDVYVDETVQFGALLVTPRVCINRPESLEPKTDSFVEIDEMTLDRKVRRIFTGWMFAESPGLNAVEHAVYDVWLKGCKQDTDVAAPNADAGTAADARQADETARQ